MVPGNDALATKTPSSSTSSSITSTSSTSSSITSTSSSGSASSSTTTSATDTDTQKTPHSIYIWSSLVAGVGSGALASILCAPLDLLKTRLQVYGSTGIQQHMHQRQGGGFVSMMRDILETEGIKGCFRGLGAALVTVPAFWGLYFPLYDHLKVRAGQEFPQVHDGWRHMGAAVCAGAISDVICNPLFVVRTRLQTEALHGSQVKMSMIQTATALYREGGLLKFWAGMSANLLGLSHVAVQFPVYEALKKKFKHDKSHESPMDLLMASATSKMIASSISYPHEVIRSRMMDSRQARISLLYVGRQIYKADGVRGFYAGLPLSLLRVLPNTCVTFLTYEIFSRWARRQLEERQTL